MHKHTHRKIFILGDAGRGKTTFAKKLSEHTKIPYYSTDDFFWKVKFTVLNDREKSVEEINQIYDKDEWIMEGTTRRLMVKGFEKVDIIYHFKFNNILYQYYSLIKRNLTGKDEKFSDLWKLLKHVTYKKYKKGYGNHLPNLEELLKPYKDKVVEINSFRKINQILRDM